MTQRLYDADAYARRFEAQVCDSRHQDNAWWLALDRTLFYPTGGGQPHDTGVLHGEGQDIPVTDVQSDEQGIIWHRTEQALEAGTAVEGQLDWPRRWDHMQQHGGEHILAGAIWEALHGFTIGLHIGAELCSIDVTMPDGRTRLRAEEVEQIELLANRHIQSDAPIRCWFPQADELKKLPLRKPPTVEKNIRIVAAGDFEMVACGGTHPGSTGQIGLVKIVDTLPARGNVRVQFACGMRALRIFQTMAAACAQTGALLSAPVDKLFERAQQLTEENARLREKMAACQRRQVGEDAARLLRGAQAVGPVKHLVCALMEDADMQQLRLLAAQLVRHQEVVALLGSALSGQGYLVFARHSGAAVDMQELIKKSGAQGGGKSDFAQGSGDAAQVLSRARELIAAMQVPYVGY